MCGKGFDGTRKGPCGAQKGAKDRRLDPGQDVGLHKGLLPQLVEEEDR